MKQFNNTVILTSKNPEAFLNFAYDVSTSDYWIIPDVCLGSKIMYINGLDTNNYLGDPCVNYALKLDATNNIASFHVYSNVNYKFDTNLRFNFYNTADLSSGTFDVSTHDVSILNRPYIISSGIINTYNNDDILVDDQASYMLLRTNPKFTGNIKIYIDCSNNIFLDTFKISDILSNKKYRRQQISSNSVLSGDIRNVFSSLPLGELYKVDKENTLSIAIPKTEYKDQYNTTYNYGAELLKDELYQEDYGLLAPLWINSILPNYFAIFRLNGVYNEETYDDLTLVNLASKYLEQSSLIKSWSLQDDSPLGKYLQTHLSDVIKISAPVFLSLTNPSIALAESDPNTWYGIAVDKGILTGRSETPYFFNQKTNNLTDLNAFISDGFERNTLLCPNLINLQYIFSDDDVSLYSMSRYFGLYLTENILYEIAYYADTSSGQISIISLDDKDSSTFMHSAIFDASGNIVTEYTNRIFVINDGEKLTRITNVNYINESSLNTYVSKPETNIFSTQVEKTNIQPFITLTINNTLEQGEHLRVINKTQNKIWEIYGTDVSSYICDKYCSISEDASHRYPIIYRTYFDINGTISNQVESIEKAFDLFSYYEGTYFRSGVRGNNWVSLILNDDACTADEWLFQRITASTLNDYNNSNSGFNNAAYPSDITFFGRFTPNASDLEIIRYDASYGPIDFELYGDRQSLTLSFFDRGINNLYSFDTSKNILDKFEEPTLYQNNDLWYQKILNFDVSNNSYQYVKDPLHIDDKVLIMTASEIKTVYNYYNAYSIKPIKISLMGINPVKDIDYTVYDSSTLNFKSDYWYKREDDNSTYCIAIDACANYMLDIPGSYVIESGNGVIYQNGKNTLYSDTSLFNTFDSSIYFSANSNTIITYAVLDGSYNYKSYKTGISEEYISSYYDSSTLLKYGLTIPLVSKWVGLGTDCRNNPLRLILNSDIFDVSTNFISDSINFSQEISYPVFKYLTPGNKAWENYLFYDINDAIQDGSTYKTFKEMMFDHPYIDYFSKLVYSNYNVNSVKSRSTIVYYNGYKNTLDTILLGLNLSLKVNNIAKSIIDIKKYDRYRFSFVSTPSKNKNYRYPIEVIINENTETILMIWYQGNDELNYNKRYSSYLPGKSLLDSTNSGFVSGKDSSLYSFIKTPYFVNNSTISKTICNLYDNKTTYSSTTARPYAQFNKNLNNFNSLWNAFENNTIVGNMMTVPKSYNTFSQDIDYNYTINNNTYGDYIANYGYKYNSNENLYTNNTTNINTLNYFLTSSTSYVMYYIIRENVIYNNYDFSGSPMSTSINPPRLYKNMYTYNFWYKPKFNNILEFNVNEESELVNITNKDFLLSNTNLKSYNNIPQLWYNKLTSSVTSSDISVGNAISYISNYNVFKSLWDADYYIKDSTYVDGYNSPDEKSSFFGSKLIKLPDELILDVWDSTSINSTETSKEITLSYNLTRTILNKFKTNIDFVINWNGLSSADNLIDSYIKNTILTYYNFSSAKIKLSFYFKPYDSRLIYHEYDNSFVINDKQNFNGQLLYENEEYIYRIIIPKTGNYSYFIKITLVEK